MNVKKLDKDRAEYLIDTVIIPSLEVGAKESFTNFLKVLGEDDSPISKEILKDLNTHLGPSQPYQGPPMPQPYSTPQGPSATHPPYHQGPPMPQPYYGHQGAPTTYPPYHYQGPPMPQPPYHGAAPPPHGKVNFHYLILHTSMY